MKKLKTLIFAITSLALVFAFTGCDKGGNFASQSYSSGDLEIASVVINVQDREISIGVSDDDQVHIDYFESEKEFYDISLSKNKELKIEFAQNKEWKDFIGTKPSEKYRKINIKIPYSLLSNLSVSTTNEEISLSPIAVSNNISLSSNGGNIRFDELAVGNELSLTAKDGNISGTVIGGYDAFSIACKIKKGECNLPTEKVDGEKSLKVDCNNGDVKIDFIKEAK